MHNVDPKIVERIKKLMALAKDGGATEAEADLAMRRAESIMLDNNLSMAMIEMAGGQAQDARQKEELGNANYQWQRWLMEEIATANFLFCEAKATKKVKIKFGYERSVFTGYELIGRMSNVISATNMFEYLLATIIRLKKEYRKTHSVKECALFTEGLAKRLSERVAVRHREALQEQREKAEADMARAKAAGNSSANAVMVILEDYERAEREANEDLRWGRPAGTTKAKREKAQDDQREWDRAMAEWQGMGKSWEEAYYIVSYQMTPEAAAEKWAKEKAERVKRDAEPKKKEKKYRWRQSAADIRSKRNWKRSQTDAFYEGVQTAETVLLDKQIDHSKLKRIAG